MKPICLLLFAALSSMQAGTVSFQFSGTVTQVPIDDVFGDIFAGDLFTGTFNFDTAALDLIPADTSAGSYTVFGLPFGIVATVSGHPFNVSDSLNIGITNSLVDFYTVQAQTSGGELTLQILLQDNTGAALADDSLPSAPPVLGNFAIRDFHLVQTFANGSELQVDGQITGLDAVPDDTPSSTAPEPSTALLFTTASLVVSGVKYVRSIRPERKRS